MAPPQTQKCRSQQSRKRRTPLKLARAPNPALQATLQQIQMRITTLPQVQQAIQNVQNGDAQPFAQTYDVTQLMTSLNLQSWMNVYTNSPAAGLWDYTDTSHCQA